MPVRRERVSIDINIRAGNMELVEYDSTAMFYFVSAAVR
jgi:hypothetical protein